MRVGHKGPISIKDMHIGDQPIEWRNSFKYLGLVFDASKKLNLDCTAIRRKFYASCNSILNKCKHAAENVKLHLIVTHYIPLLTYCICALNLNDAWRLII